MELRIAIQSLYAVLIFQSCYFLIEQQREALEGANTNTAVLQTMGEAAKALKHAHADMDVDKVHDMMDDIAEQQDVAKEISDAISNPVAFGQEFDEDDLEAELNELEVKNTENAFSL